MTDVEKERLRRNVHNILKKNHLSSQTELSERSGISQPVISKALKGQSTKGLERVAKWLIEQELATQENLYTDDPQFMDEYEKKTWEILVKIDNRQKDMFELLKRFTINVEENIAKNMGAKPKK